MATVKLKDAVTGKKQITYTKKEELRASVCDGCGLVHTMDGFAPSDRPGQLHGIFDHSSAEKGNQFFATVCSFVCADFVMNGAWKKMKEYKEFAKAGAQLVRAEVKITPFVKTKNQLIKEWNKKPEHEVSGTRTGFY